MQRRTAASVLSALLVLSGSPVPPLCIACQRPAVLLATKQGSALVRTLAAGWLCGALPLLTTKNGRIVDRDGVPVHMHGIAWYGFNGGCAFEFSLTRHTG